MHFPLIHSSKQLDPLSMKEDVSFKIILLGQPLYCDTLLRAMPRKRITIKGQWNNQLVVVKLFFSTRKKEHFKKEAKGIEKLNQAKIPVPTVLYQGKIHDFFIILFTFIEPDCDLNEIWLNDNEEKVKTLLVKMQKIIIVQHQHNLFHKDLHINNFILSQANLFMLDAGDIQTPFLLFKKLSYKKSLQNLALFYSQLHVKYQPLILDLFKHYCASRRWPYTSTLEHSFSHELNRARYKRIKRLTKRLFRNCREIRVKQSCLSFFAYHKDLFSSDLEHFSKYPDQYIKKGQIIKAGNTCTTTLISLNNQPYIVKRYNIKNLWHLLTHCWRTSRAAKSWRNAHILTLFGLPTAKPIALLEKRLGPFRGKTYFLCEYLNAPLLSELFKSDPNAHKKNEIFAHAIILLKDLFNLRILYKDMKSTNFIANDSKLYLIDVDDIKVSRYQRSFTNRFKKCIDRFMKNWENDSKTSRLLSTLLDSFLTQINPD